jgi:hypothetical protein
MREVLFAVLVVAGAVLGGWLSTYLAARARDRDRIREALPAFLALYDTVSGAGWQALDLAQNLLWRQTNGEPVVENDVAMAYGLAGMGDGQSYDLMGLTHALAAALGYTRADYIDGAEKRRGQGGVSIYVAGQGSVNLTTEGLFGEAGIAGEDS